MVINDYNSGNYNAKLQKLRQEEERLEKYLQENSNTISQDEASRIQSTLTGVKSEAQEIDQLLSGGFY